MTNLVSIDFSVSMEFIGHVITMLTLVEFTTIFEFLDFSMVCDANRYRCYPSVTPTVTPLTYLLTYTYKVKVSKGNKVTQKYRHYARGALLAIWVDPVYISFSRVTCYVLCKSNNAIGLDRNS